MHWSTPRALLFLPQTNYPAIACRSTRQFFLRRPYECVFGLFERCRSPPGTHLRQQHDKIFGIITPTASFLKKNDAGCYQEEDKEPSPFIFQGFTQRTYCPVTVRINGLDVYSHDGGHFLYGMTLYE